MPLPTSLQASRLQAPLGRGPRQGPPGGPTPSSPLAFIHVLCYFHFFLSSLLCLCLPFYFLSVCLSYMGRHGFSLSLFFVGFCILQWHTHILPFYVLKELGARLSSSVMYHSSTELCYYLRHGRPDACFTHSREVSPPAGACFQFISPILL